MRIYEVKIRHATLKRNCFVEFLFSHPDFGRKYSFDMSKNCDRKRLELLFDYVNANEIYELNGKSVKLMVNEQDNFKTAFIAIGNMSTNRFFLLEATEVVEMGFDDVLKLYSKAE